MQTVFIDGSGPGWICILFENGSALLTKERVSSHNEAEWKALYFALEHLKPDLSYLILTDSQLVAFQFNGVYKTRSPKIRYLKDGCYDLIGKKGLNVRVKWIPRYKNRAGEILESIMKGG